MLQSLSSIPKKFVGAIRKPGRVAKVQKENLPEILSWFAARKMGSPPLWSFSDEGFMLPGVAAGFLYITNSSIAFIDFYITNPDTSADQRKEALHLITGRIITVAKFEHGVKMLCCNSKIGSIKDLAAAFNFHEHGENAVFSKVL